MSEQPTADDGVRHGLSYAEPSLRNKAEPLDPVVVRAVGWACAFFLTPIPCVLAIVYGVAGIRRTRELKTRGYAHAWVAVVVGVAGIIGWIWATKVAIDIRRAIQQAVCMSNEREIEMNLLLYAEQNQGFYPARLRDLLALKMSPGVLACPASGLPTPAATGAAGVPTSYVLLAPGMPAKAFGPSDVVLVELSAHPTGRVAVAYGDGHVDMLTVDAAAAEAQKTLDKIASMRAATRPAATRPGV